MEDYLIGTKVTVYIRRKSWLDLLLLGGKYKRTGFVRTLDDNFIGLSERLDREEPTLFISTRSIHEIAVYVKLFPDQGGHRVLVLHGGKNTEQEATRTHGTE